jgi:S-adenosylmethionine hydrolase
LDSQFRKNCSKSIITLLTDFGTDDEYVGIMKGVILSVNPFVSIIDISHHIAPQDLSQAAYLIKSCYRYFPERTVHVVVVDPGVGSDRSIIALKMKNHIFLAPDNGVLRHLMDEGGIESIIHVDNSSYFLKPVSRTFHGRDIFAPVAAHISKGVEIKKLGTPIDKNDLVNLSIQKPYISDKGEIIGTIISIDRFGNLITNIDLDSIKMLDKEGMGKRLEVRIGENKIIGLSLSYKSVRSQSPLAIIGGRGYLEIAVNCGSAKQYFMAKKGDTIRVI